MSSFLFNVLIFYPLHKPEKQKFSDDFEVHKMGIYVTNGVNPLNASVVLI